MSEGAIFTSDYEGVQKFQVGDVTLVGNRMHVTIQLSNTDSGEVYRWSDVAIFEEQNGVWLLDDIWFENDASHTLRKRITVDAP